eukprot:PhM_4_TR111/c0_g3_i1/m.11373
MTAASPALRSGDIAVAVARFLPLAHVWAGARLVCRTWRSSIDAELLADVSIPFVYLGERRHSLVGRFYCGIRQVVVFAALPPVRASLMPSGKAAGSSGATGSLFNVALLAQSVLALTPPFPASSPEDGGDRWRSIVADPTGAEQTGLFTQHPLLLVMAMPRTLKAVPSTREIMADAFSAETTATATTSRLRCVVQRVMLHTMLDDAFEPPSSSSKDQTDAAAAVDAWMCTEGHRIFCELAPHLASNNSDVVLFPDSDNAALRATVASTLRSSITRALHHVAASHNQQQEDNKPKHHRSCVVFDNVKRVHDFLACAGQEPLWVYYEDPPTNSSCPHSFHKLLFHSTGPPTMLPYQSVHEYSYNNTTIIPTPTWVKIRASLRSKRGVLNAVVLRRPNEINNNNNNNNQKRVASAVLDRLADTPLMCSACDPLGRAVYATGRVVLAAVMQRQQRPLDGMCEMVYVADNEALKRDEFRDLRHPREAAALLSALEHALVDTEREVEEGDDDLFVPWLLIGAPGTHSTEHVEPADTYVYVYLSACCRTPKLWFLYDAGVGGWGYLVQRPGDVVLLPPRLPHVVVNCVDWEMEEDSSLVKEATEMMVRVGDKRMLRLHVPAGSCWAAGGDGHHHTVVCCGGDDQSLSLSFAIARNFRIT